MKNKNKKNKILDLDKYDEAMIFINDNTNKLVVDINPSILPLLPPMPMSNKTHGDMQYNLPDCNHNTPNGNKVCQITNNMYGNPMGVNTNTLHRLVPM